MPSLPSLPSSTHVLVVGAGPTGLACAITLAQEGQPVVIVDASDSNANGCRAGSVHANTLETLDSIGCAQPLVETGFKVEEMRIYDGTAQRLGIPIGPILRDKFKAKFPFLCGIPQHETERVLREKLSELGVEVIRGKRLVGYSEAPGAIDVQFEDGSTIRTKYLVGADGSRSMVRTLAGMTFKDPNTGASYYTPGTKSVAPGNILDMVLADVKISGYLPEGSMHHRFSLQLVEGGSIILFPFTSSQYATGSEEQTASFFRFGTILRKDDPPPPKDLDMAFVQALIDKYNPWPERIVIEELYTASRYQAKSAISNSFFRGLDSGGKILLAGDAAHIHPPFGGQGLNLGICDGVALGRAIVEHTRLDEKQTDEVLISYSERRHAIAERVIGLAKGLERMNSPRPWTKWIRRVALFFMWRIPRLQELMVWRVSGLVNRE